MKHEPSFVRSVVHENVENPDEVVVYETWKGTRESWLAEEYPRPYRKPYEDSLAELVADRSVAWLSPITGPAAPHPPGSIGADQTTVAVYDRDAALFAEDWSSQPPPDDMYDILRRFFEPGATADVGCGAGRDTAWLDANGFPAIGFDASSGLLAEARRRHPNVRFEQASLPALRGVAQGHFRNVLCETVIMHLPPSSIRAAVDQLMSILEPGGTLYLSWRLAVADASRDAQGRLYAAFDAAEIMGALDGAEILMDEQPISASSGKPIRRVVARKPAISAQAANSSN